MILTLDANKVDFNKVGAKAYNLVLLKQKGFDVPNGFVVTTETYDDYVKQNNITEQITQILSSKSSLAEKSKTIQDLFTINKLPQSLVDEVTCTLELLDNDRFAVRSSSTMEDLSDMSFAGQYSSFLGVRKEGVIGSVLDCWKSLWNERAISYREKNQQNVLPTHAVLVQEMVNASSAGVIFTANPMNGLRNEHVINASFGIGEAIVSGEVMPDEYVYDVLTQTLVGKQVHDKKTQVVLSKTGVDLVDIGEESQKLQTLKLEEIQLLSHTALNIQNVFGKPQDIEFAIDQEGLIHVLQSRNITTLFPIEAFEQDNKLRPNLCASTVLLGMKEALTPLGADIYGGMFPRILQVMTMSKKPVPKTFVKYAGARIYLDITYMMASKFVSKQFAGAFSGSDLPLKATMESMTDKHGKKLRNQGIRFKMPWGILKYSLSMIGPFRQASKIPEDMKYKAIIELGEEVINNLEEASKNKKTIEERVAFVDEIMMQVFMLSQKQAMYCTEVSALAKINKMIGKLFNDKYNTDVLTYSLPGCITVQMSHDLNTLAKYFDENKLEPTIEDQKFRDFLKRFGHRGTIELDAGTPRWSEDPRYIMNQVNTYMCDKSYLDNLKSIDEGALKAEAFIQEVSLEAIKIKGRKYGNKLEKLMRLYRRAAGMREYPKFNILQGAEIARRVMLELGEDLKNAGILTEAQDIFFLRQDNILNEVQNLRAMNPSSKAYKTLMTEVELMIITNKELYESEMRRTSIPRIVMNTGEMFYTGKMTPAGENAIQGYPLSTGTYEGVIRIVHDPLSSELKQGEIMVAESTNPAWTPLFMVAKGLIVEYGGPLSHGGIVAREYGIPAVVGISAATSKFKDGQKVRIDGSSGIVEILD